MNLSGNLAKVNNGFGWRATFSRHQQKGQWKILEANFLEFLSYQKPKLKISQCAKSFLSTLGYTSRTVVDFLLKACKDGHGNKLSISLPDRRGHHEPPQKISSTPIKLHINSYSPKPSHYRRNHAPNRKYLPPLHKDDAQ